MVIPPNNWIINENNGANCGGYLLSEFTNVSYQGYLDSKSYRLHEHRLSMQKVNHINYLQKVKFTINQPMVNFYYKYAKRLTDSNRLLLTDIWVKPNEQTILEVNRKWARVYDNVNKIRDAVTKELSSKRNETLKNIETLKIAELYCGKTIYWPAVQDFRGRIYRIGNLNIQLNEFVRSLIGFQSEKSLVKKKNKSTEAKFNLLLKDVLVNYELITRWDAIFGNRAINSNDKFEKLLLEDLLTKKISLIQVGQLLLIRQGAYDQIGVYYDASASAYQVMGHITGDIKLCELTNVISSPSSEIKQDIYTNCLELIKQNTFNLVANKDKE